MLLLLQAFLLKLNVHFIFNSYKSISCIVMKNVLKNILLSSKSLSLYTSHLTASKAVLNQWGF